MFVLKKIIPLAILTATLPFLAPGCSAGGSIAQAEFIAYNPITGLPLFRILLTNIRWGPKAPLPTGSTFACNAEVNGNDVQIFDAPDGSQWMVDSDGDAHPIVSGPVDCTGGGLGDAIGLPTPIGNNTSGIQTESLIYQFDESLDIAVVTITLGVEYLPNYLPSSELPFLVQEAGMQQPNGDLRLTYTGTINDVLGTLWWIGIKKITFSDPSGIPVVIQWADDMNVVTIKAGPSSQMIVMTPTNMANWPSQ